jgi:hypothetical protein
MPKVTFAAKVRWRSRTRPDWELDTSQGGFATAERAALFANGLGQVAVGALWLEDGSFVLELSDGRRVAFAPTELVVWHRAAEAQSLPDIAGFERVDRTPRELSREGLDGHFEPRAFRVVTEAAPPKDIEVLITVDLQRDVLRVVVLDPVRSADSDADERPPTPFALVPRA